MKTIDLFTRTTAATFLGLLLLGCATAHDVENNTSVAARMPASQSVDPGSGSSSSTTAPDKWLELSKEAIPFEVFRNWDDRPEHGTALIAVVQTDKAGKQFGLVFMQRISRRGPGLGIVCRESKRLVNSDTGKPDDAYRCHQHIGAMTETLTVGLIESKFCEDLRTSATNNKRITTDKANPIVTPKECSARPNGEPCICFEIKHARDSALVDKSGIPPTDGSGSGGRRGGG